MSRSLFSEVLTCPRSRAANANGGCCAQLLCFCSSTLLSLAAAQAQDLPFPEEAAGEEGEIIVTASRVEGYKVDTAQSATKTDVALIDTPMSVQVISSEVIRDMGATDLYSVVRNVSGVTRRAAYWEQSTAIFAPEHRWAIGDADIGPSPALFARARASARAG